MKTTLLAFLLSLFLNLTITAQTKSEFFVKVNPITGTFQNIMIIPSIRWIPEGGLSWKYSTYDCKNRQFIFNGLDSSYNRYLVTIDAATGTVLHSPPLPNTGDTLDDVFYLHYDTTTNKTYGIFKDASSFPPFVFVSIDQVTGNVTPISNLTGITNIAGGDQYSAFDAYNGRYIFYGVNGGGKLFTLDVNTGSIIYSPPIGGNYREFQFDAATNKLYGLLLSGTPPNVLHTLVSIDITTGNYTTIATIPGVVDITSGGMQFSTFDSNHGRYIFRGGDGTGNWNLYSIDVNNGNVIYNPPYPLPPINLTTDNVIELQYDNSSDILYALHWGDIEKTTSITNPNNEPSFSVFPNPTNGQINIKTSFNIIDIKIKDLLGKEIYQATPMTNIFSLQLTTAGIYFITFSSDKQTTITKLIVVK